MAAKKKLLVEKKSNKKVKGTFKYVSRPGEYLEFPFRVEKGQPVQNVKLYDGQKSTISMELLNHLRTSGKENIYKYRPDENGHSVMKIVGETSRWYFEVEDFEDEEDVAAEEIIDIEIE